MWGPFCLLWILAWSVLGAPSPQSTPCPEDCECATTTKSGGISARCSSQNFLHALTAKQLHDITELHLAGSSIKIVDHKLKKLRNLSRLDLSNNRIESLDHFPQFYHLTHLDLSGNALEKLAAESLPKSIEHLDVSSNRIRVLGKDATKYLPNLREVNLNGNPLACGCDFVRDRDHFTRNDVHIVRPANCYTPENVRGVSWLSVHCFSGQVTYDDLGEMLADEPGSGEDVGSVVVAPASSDILGLEPDEEDFQDNDDIEGEYMKFKDGNSSSSESVEDGVEGSGSAYYDVTSGSGDGEFIPVSPDPHVRNCYFNCSTPPPTSDVDETDPPASIDQEISRFLGDISGRTTIAMPTTTTTTQVPVHEEEVQKSAATLSTGIRANIEAPKESQATQDVAKKNNTTTYVVVGVLFVAMVALVAYVVVKKRNARNHDVRRPVSNHDVKEPLAVEMKPLVTQSPPYKPNPPAERTPLINGQNGTNKKPEEDQPDAKVDIPNGFDATEEEEPQIRPKKEDDALLTPGTKRVTIQAKELSSPKSPVLVTRRVGDDGNIVSSPLPNEFKYT